MKNYTFSILTIGDEPIDISLTAENQIIAWQKLCIVLSEKGYENCHLQSEEEIEF